MAPDGWVENNLDLNDDIYCESNELDCQGTLCGNVIADECGICGGSGIPECDCV